jgi:hypothetical protein
LEVRPRSVRTVTRSCLEHGYPQRQRAHLREATLRRGRLKWKRHGRAPGLRVAAGGHSWNGRSASVSSHSALPARGFAAHHRAAPRGGAQGGGEAELRGTAGAVGEARALSPLTRSLDRRD